VQVAPLKDAWANRHLLICSAEAAAAQPAVQALIAALLAT